MERRPRVFFDCTAPVSIRSKLRVIFFFMVFSDVRSMTECLLNLCTPCHKVFVYHFNNLNRSVPEQ